jgi:UDP-3-O-[3-hydroxymyristoyl] N-acetylglucosamine deacetylase/3-hydroxyacyl-[acyl-carrier-protein] dehydratase
VAKQKTIAKPFHLEGTGLFSSKPVSMSVKPAEADSGVVFVRTDLDEPVRIPALIGGLKENSRRTSLQNGKASIDTTEHFLAAVNGLGLDNLEVEINSSELPNSDGSCDLFTQSLLKAGSVEQELVRRELIISEPVMVSDGDAKLYALPDRKDELTIIYDLDYPEFPPIGRQVFPFRMTPENFVQQLSSARTFCTQAEATALQASGLATHLTSKEALVFGPDGPLDTTLRFPDECVRHKIADLLGDIMLLGRAIQGRLVAYRSGHHCNHLLVKKLLEQCKPAAKKNSTNVMQDIRKIQKILPHRYPFLLVDRVINIEGEKRAVGIKNVTMNEPFFQGHYPGTPIMPGVMIIEALAQMSGLLFAQKLEHVGQLPVLLGMDKVKMRRAVVPGDQIILEVEVKRMKTRTATCSCRALVAGQLVAEAQLRFMLVDADPI